MPEGSFHDYLAGWGRTLLTLRASDAFDTNDCLDRSLSQFDSSIQELQEKGSLQAVEHALARLEEQGLVKQYTASTCGVTGFWEGSKPLLEVLASIQAALADASPAANLHVIVQKLRGVEFWNGESIPASAWKSRRVQADFVAWKHLIEQECCNLLTKVQEYSKQKDSPPRAQEFAAVEHPLAVLERAMANADLDIHSLADAIASCRAEPSGDFVDKLAAAEEMIPDLMADRLENAIQCLDPKNLWATWVRMFRLMAKCRMLALEIPAYHKAKELSLNLGLSEDMTLDVIKVPRTEPSVLAYFQKLFDVARSESFESTMELKRLLVERVVEVRHECTRAEYRLRRAQLLQDIEANEPLAQVSVRSQDPSLEWPEILGTPPEAKYNEFFAFHGTSPCVAEIITETDFKIKRHPDNGFTFGRGAYMAEYVTHAQFFASSLCEGLPGGRCAIIVCRVFCGRVNDVGTWENTATRHTNADDFERELESGRYHSTMGAEWPDNYELREFVLADDDQVLPEFVVICGAAE